MTPPVLNVFKKSAQLALQPYITILQITEPIAKQYFVCVVTVGVLRVQERLN